MVFKEQEDKTIMKKAPGPIIETPVQRASAAITDSKTNNDIIKNLSGSFSDIKINYVEKGEKKQYVYSDFTAREDKSVDIKKFDKMSQYSIEAAGKDGEGNLRKYTINVNDGYATIDESEKKVIVAIGSKSQDAFEMAAFLNKQKDITPQDRDASMMAFVEKKGTLDRLEKEEPTAMRAIKLEFNKTVDDPVIREKLDQNVDNPNKYYEILKNNGLYKQFLEFLVKKLEDASIASGGSTSPAEIQVAFVQGNILTEAQNKDVAEQIDIAKRKAPDNRPPSGNLG